MASGSWTFGTSNQYIQGMVQWSSTSNGSAANTSTVSVSVYFRRTNTGYHSWGHINTGVQCDGGVYWENNYYVDIYNDWVLTNARSYTVSHGSDGKKSCYIRAVGNADFGLSFDTSTYVNLDTIPRYTTINKFDITDITQTSIKVSIGATDAIDFLQYRINGGSWQNGMDNFTISDLSPNTSYTLQVTVRRQDSQLWTNSDTKSFTTSPVVSITNSSVDFNIGSDIDLTFKDYDLSKFFVKFYVQNLQSTWEEVVSVDEALTSDSYTLNLSSYTSTLYSKVSTRNNAKILIECGSTLNGTIYKNSIEGTMYVVNSNPSFSDYTYGDADNTTQSVLGNSAYMIQGYGDMQAHISTDNKAVAKNGASILSYIANIYNSNDQVVATQTKSYSESQVDFSFGNINVIGTYYLKIYAIDSRSNSTSTISKTFYVLPYHAPMDSIDLHRMNKYEKEMSISLSIIYSKLIIGSTNKNASISVSYKYKESSSTSWSSAYPISVSSSNYSTTDMNATYANSNFAIGDITTLDVNKTYDFIFYISDKLQTKQVAITVSQGTPIMFIGDEGHVTVGRLPDLSNSDLLQVNSDITCKDTDNQDAHVMLEIRRNFQCSTTVPDNQKLGGLFFYEHEYKD